MEALRKQTATLPVAVLVYLAMVATIMASPQEVLALQSGFQNTAPNSAKPNFAGQVVGSQDGVATANNVGQSWANYSDPGHVIASQFAPDNRLIANNGSETYRGDKIVEDRQFRFAKLPEKDFDNVSRPISEADLASVTTAGEFQNNRYVTRNFLIQAPSAALAKTIGDHAEFYRQRLSLQWLGNTLPAWPSRCPIQVNVSHQAHGETSFMLPEYGVGDPTDWDMIIHGPVDRLIDSVLPHEITHTIFASHFGQRLPRWADEGACTTVEHPIERDKIHAMLLRFLSPREQRGIPFNRMFPMRDYPQEMLPLYAQGYSVTRFLIAQGGHQKFVQLIERGLQLEQKYDRQQVLQAWNQAMDDVYSYQDLSELQLDWLKWVQEGSDEGMALARMQRRNDDGLVTANVQAQPEVRPAGLLSSDYAMQSDNTAIGVIGNNGAVQFSKVNSSSAQSRNDNFYVRQMNGQNETGLTSATATGARLDAVARVDAVSGIDAISGIDAGAMTEVNSPSNASAVFVNNSPVALDQIPGRGDVSPTGLNSNLNRAGQNAVVLPSRTPVSNVQLKDQNASQLAVRNYQNLGGGRRMLQALPAPRTESLVSPLTSQTRADSTILIQPKLR